MQEYPELKFSDLKDYSLNKDKPHKRMWATLCFHLGMKLKELRLINFHTRKNEEVEQWLTNLVEASKLPDKTEALKKCLDVGAITVPRRRILNPNAAKMLAGMDDKTELERQVSDLVVVNQNGLMGSDSTVIRLLSMGWCVINNEHANCTRVHALETIDCFADLIQEHVVGEVTLCLVLQVQACLLFLKRQISINSIDKI